MSSLSKPLDRLLNGQMKEAIKGRVVWDEMDGATFALFIQWAYSGSYTDPEPVIFTDSSLIATSTTEDGNVAKNPTATAGAGNSVTITLEGHAESLISRPGDIVCLIAYAFHTFSESAEDDKMCDMPVHYSGCIYENLIAYDGFKTLVEDCPLFIHGLMKKIAERLS
ncbi:hypothetical protein DL768_008885 [Monosporascus sp. mg162]|nr:hypothetical protein DL768_008885 [Monosporascus sp. mg162]